MFIPELTKHLKLNILCHILIFRSQRHPFERVPTPFQVYTWMAPSMEHTIDSIRAEDGKCIGYGQVCGIAGMGWGGLEL